LQRVFFFVDPGGCPGHELTEAHAAVKSGHAFPAPALLLDLPHEIVPGSINPDEHPCLSDHLPLVLQAAIDRLPVTVPG